MSSLKSVTVYLGSSGRAAPRYQESAARLGRACATQGIRLVYGGTDTGLMRILADSALQAGGDVWGVIPKRIVESRRQHMRLTRLIHAGDLWERKQGLFSHGQAMAVLPGGYGTLDEACEVLYWAHLGLHRKPLVFVNSDGYWDAALRHLRRLPDVDPERICAVDHEEDAIPFLAARLESGSADTPTDLPHFETEILDPRAMEAGTPYLVTQADLKDTCRLITALGLKQLGKHHRPIGVLNADNVWGDFFRWVDHAARETFLTEKCPRLMIHAPTQDSLDSALSLAPQTPTIHIDVEKEKWAEPEEA